MGSGSMVGGYDGWRGASLGGRGGGAQGAQGASGAQGPQGAQGGSGGGGGGVFLGIDEAAPYDNPLAFTPIGGNNARVVLFQYVYDFDQLGATLDIYLSGVIGRTINNQFGTLGLFILAPDPDVTVSSLFSTVLPVASFFFGTGALGTKVKDDVVELAVVNTGGLRQVLVAAITGTDGGDYAPPIARTLTFWSCVGTVNTSP